MKSLHILLPIILLGCFASDVKKLNVKSFKDEEPRKTSSTSKLRSASQPGRTFSYNQGTFLTKYPGSRIKTKTRSSAQDDAHNEIKELSLAAKKNTSLTDNVAKHFVLPGNGFLIKGQMKSAESGSAYRSGYAGTPDNQLSTVGNYRGAITTGRNKRRNSLGGFGAKEVLTGYIPIYGSTGFQNENHLNQETESLNDAYKGYGNNDGLTFYGAENYRIAQNMNQNNGYTGEINQNQGNYGITETTDYNNNYSSFEYNKKPTGAETDRSGFSTNQNIFSINPSVGVMPNDLNNQQPIDYTSGLNNGFIGSEYNTKNFGTYSNNYGIAEDYGSNNYNIRSYIDTTQNQDKFINLPQPTNTNGGNQPEVYLSAGAQIFSPNSHANGGNYGTTFMTTSNADMVNDYGTSNYNQASDYSQNVFHGNSDSAYTKTGEISTGYTGNFEYFGNSGPTYGTLSIPNFNNANDNSYTPFTNYGSMTQNSFLNNNDDSYGSGFATVTGYGKTDLNNINENNANYNTNTPFNSYESSGNNKIYEIQTNPNAGNSNNYGNSNYQVTNQGISNYNLWNNKGYSINYPNYASALASNNNGYNQQVSDAIGGFSEYKDQIGSYTGGLSTQNSDNLYTFSGYKNKA